MPDPVRLAIVGLGLVGRRHAAAILPVREAEWIGTVEPGAEGRAFSADQGVPCFDDLDTMLAEARPDGVILATPTTMHVAQGLACVAAGCPLLVEKPLAVSCAEAEVLVAAAEAASVPLLVGHHRRHNPLIHKAREVIAAGRIGDVRAAHATCWFYKPDAYFEVAPWRTRKGAGPISVNLVHDVDLLRAFCGEVAGVRAMARPSRRGHENEDVAAAILDFANGAIGTITVSDGIAAPWSWELTAREYPVYPPTSESCYLIGGSKGSLSVPDLRIWTHAGDAPDWWAPISATSLHRDASDPLVNQIAHFAAVIRGEAMPLVSGVEGLKTLQVVEAIQISAETGRAVDLSGAL